MTLDKMRYVLKQVNHFERDDLQLCFYLKNGGSLIGIIDLHGLDEDEEGAGIVGIEDGSGDIAYIDVEAIAAVRIIFPEDEPKPTDGPSP